LIDDALNEPDDRGIARQILKTIEFFLLELGCGRIQGLLSVWLGTSLFQGLRDLTSRPDEAHHRTLKGKLEASQNRPVQGIPAGYGQALVRDRERHDFLRAQKLNIELADRDSSACDCVRL